MKKNDICTVEIVDMSFQGEGIGKFEGYTLFVKDAVVGDVVRAKVTKAKKSYGYARLEELLAASPYRVEPPCPQHRRCGGCQLQGLSYEKQLELKENKVKSDLERIGGLSDVPVRPIIGMEQPIRYRNKAQYPVGRDKDGNLVAGFYAGRTHSIIDSEECFLGQTVNGEILRAVKAYMKECHVQPYDEQDGSGLVRHVMIRSGKAEKAEDGVSDEAETSLYSEGPGAEQSTAEKTETTETALHPERADEAARPGDGAGPGAGEETLHSERADEAARPEDGAGQSTAEIMVCLVTNGNKLPKSDVLIEKLRNIPAVVSIMQNVNCEQTNVILGTQVRTLWGKPAICASIGNLRFFVSPLSFFQINPVQTERLYGKALEYAGLTGNEIVWDLYCGIGTISLFLAQNAKQVYGVEIVPQAIEDARRNAVANGISNAQFFVGKAEEVVPRKYAEEGISADVVVVDPPRKGCDETLLATIIKMAPARVVYVSCDPATLARDVKYLAANGYEVKEVTPVDMFPMTVHVETVVLLSKAN